jgi:hypothetical protein
MSAAQSNVNRLLFHHLIARVPAAAGDPADEESDCEGWAMLVSLVSSALCLVAGWYGRDVIQIIMRRFSKWRIAQRRTAYEKDRNTCLDWVVTYYGGESGESRLWDIHLAGVG